MYADLDTLCSAVYCTADDGMAVTQRNTATGLVAHSDHGSQYTSLLYGTHAKTSGIALSMGSIGDPWGNAVAETRLRHS